MDKNELYKILKKHEDWLKGKDGGECACLDNADLSKMDLRKVNLNMASLKNINLYRADLSGATLCMADLEGADLSDVDLQDADLIGVNLSDAKLFNAKLIYANLTNANLHNAGLYRANLSEATLSGADLSGADLYKANLYEADLRMADLNEVGLDGVNLCDADLRGVKNIPFIPYACPETGSFIGYKKASGHIVVLEILEDALRSSATGRKCRCNKARVTEIQNKDGSIAAIKSVASSFDRSFIYTVGEIIEEPNFNMDRWSECAEGIHFFINRQEAVDY